MTGVAVTRHRHAVEAHKPAYGLRATPQRESIVAGRPDRRGVAQGRLGTSATQALADARRAGSSTTPAFPVAELSWSVVMPWSKPARDRRDDECPLVAWQW